MSVTALRSLTRGMSAMPGIPFSPGNIHQMFTGIEVPDPITFITDERWLNRPSLYPRQATLIKIIFLRDDLFTEYDRSVIEEWEAAYRLTGFNGIVPNIRLRIKLLKRAGAKWFREVLLVLGRRAGKGYISALCLAYVMWHYMAKGDPQGFYGIDRDQRLACLVFAGKRGQAKATVFADLVSVISGSNCYAPYISTYLVERLSVYAPHDFVRMRRMAAKGISTQRDLATFEILPKESTPMAGRGPTSFMQAWDEMAHVVTGSGGRSVDEVYDAAKPSTDQFGKDAFLIEPSSPWQMMGKFYDNYVEAVAVDADGDPVRPNYMMVQLTSWDIYLDWERAAFLPMFPQGFQGDLGEYADLDFLPCYTPLRGAIQVFDDEMRREKAANPETFAVERESHFAVSLDAYLNQQKVREVFGPWEGRPAKYGSAHITEQTSGLLIYTYKGHADPSKVNDKFGWAMAHVEIDDQGRWHAVFDRIGHFDPVDFPDAIIDYEYVDDWIWENLITSFYPDEFTFDQYNSTSSVQKLAKRIRTANPGLPKHVTVFEKTVTRPYDWTVKENSKAAINLGLVHAPWNERAYDELRYLQLVNGRVDHPTAGPVQSKDIADAMTECIHVLIGEQTRNFMHSDLRSLRPGMGSLGEPFPGMSADGPGSPADQNRLAAMSGFTRARGNMGGQHDPRRRRRY